LEGDNLHIIILRKRRKKICHHSENEAKAAKAGGKPPPPQHPIIPGARFLSGRRGLGQTPATQISPPWWSPMRKVTLIVEFLETSLPALLIPTRNLREIKNHSKKGRSLKFQLSTAMLQMTMMSKKLSPS